MNEAPCTTGSRSAEPVEPDARRQRRAPARELARDDHRGHAPLKLITIMSAGHSKSSLRACSSSSPAQRRPLHVPPELRGSVEDNRNTVSVRDWNKPTFLNTTRAYDIVNPNPIVQVHYDVKGKGGRAGDTPEDGDLYLNNKSTTSQFVRSLMPVLFAAVAQTVNHVGSDLTAMYITNALLIGLIAVFTIPAIPRRAPQDRLLRASASTTCT